MNIIILLFGLFDLFLLSNCICLPDSSNYTKCHDGGCSYALNYTEYIKPGELFYGTRRCNCIFSETIMHGANCGVYNDMCKENACGHEGTCQSGIGHTICTCPKNTFGNRCQIKISPDYLFREMKRPSIYYRIKSKPGQELFLLAVSETFGNDTYDVFIKGVLTTFRFELESIRKRMKVSDVIKLCSNKLNSTIFNVNSCGGPDNDECQNMCNFIPKIYGDDTEVDIALIGPYFLSKSKHGSDTKLFSPKDFGRLKGKNIMGNKYVLEVRFESKTYNAMVHEISYFQFLVPDELDLCLPFIEDSPAHDPVLKNFRDIEKVYKGSEKWFTKIKLMPGDQCTIHEFKVEEKYEWKAFEFNKNVQSYTSDEGFIKLHQEHEDYLKLELPIGLFIMFYRVSKEDLEGYTASNFYLRYIEIKTLSGLIAKITGPLILYFEEKDKYLTIDASESYNPNENENDKKKNLLFTWECDIETDNICEKRTFKEPNNKIDKYLHKKAFQYKYKLTVSVDNDYSTRIGIVPEVGIAQVTLSYSESDIRIECIRNCKPLSDPSNEIHLKLQMSFIHDEVEWFYQTLNDTNMNSVTDIILTDVPVHMLVVKKDMLNYGTTYYFIIKYTKYEIIKNISITTISLPKYGNCKIDPTSGLAWTTSFTITCINVNNENNFEYYQKNKNDNSTMGVLLDQGNGTTTNIKLTSSNYLTVKIFNKYGASTQEQLVVDISESNNHIELNKLFKILNSNLKRETSSRAVSLIAILSDVLHDNHINEFHKLFNAFKKFKFSKIPLNSYIFSIEQFVLILQKVVFDFYQFNGNKLETTELSKISNQFLRASNSLFDYIKRCNDDEKIVNMNRVEQIKKELRKNMIFVQNNITNITNLDDNNKKPIIINDTGRYFWSSYDKLKMITNNIEDYVKELGKSIIVDLLPYERPVACDDRKNDFKACVLSPKWVTNQSYQWDSNLILLDTVGEKLSSEILLKGGSWGIMKYDVKNNLIQSFDQVNTSSQIIMPIVSLDIFSVGNLRQKNMIAFKQFKNYINLNIKTNETIKRPHTKYSIPIYAGNINNSLEIDKTILVHKIDMQNIGELYVTLSDSTHDLCFSWLRGNRPDKAIMGNEMYSIKLEAGTTNELTLKTLNEHRDEIHYIGVSANTNGQITQNFYVNFSMDMVTQKCLYWTGDKWASGGIIVGPNTTENNIQCQANHMSLFSGVIYTLPDVVDPIEEISHAENIADNLVCLLVIGTVFVVYVILFIWSRYQDDKDISRGEIVILHDNYPGEDEVYLVTVYTGNYSEAGTTANVCIQLHGNVTSSRAHWLHNSSCNVLQRFSDDWFIIFTTKSLGELEYIHIWTDSYGNNPRWYCKRIEVIDVRRQKSWNFNVEKWFSLSNIEDSIISQDLQKKALDDIELTIRDEHLWASVFVRHPRSLITRCQRLSKILCLLLSVMLISLMFYEFNDDDEQFLHFEINLSQVSIAIQSSIIEAIMTFGTSYCFDKSAEFERNVIVSDRLKEHSNYGRTKNIHGRNETWWKKIIVTVLEKKIFLPALTENKVKKNKRSINFWLIIGWTLCILIYVFSASLIIAYGLKLGQVKSLHWLMTVLMTIIQSAFLAEPIQIIISSCILFKLNQERNNKTTQYIIKLDDFRNNTKSRLQDLSLIQYIREGRKKFLYYPFTRSDAQILLYRQSGKIKYLHLRENAITCILIIITSLCCISALYSFNSPKHIIHANNVNNLFLKSLLQTDVMDLEKLKTFLTVSLVDVLNMKEYYNGIPISNDSRTYSNNVRGWYSLYNSKLINGGIRLKQLRIREENLEWKNDMGNYKEGWIEAAETEDITAWSYRSIPVTKYFGLWFPETDNSGFILDLTGDLFEYKKILKTHLENEWLDNKTRNIIVEFQTFTPNIDSITVFNIKLHSESGLLYTVTTVVWTVPSSSVLIDWTTYVFTLVFMSAYTVTAVRLTSSVMRMMVGDGANDDNGAPPHERFWTAYECALLAIVVAVSFAVTGRWRLMDVAGTQYVATKEAVYVASVTDMCRTHGHVAALASVAVAMALFRCIRLVMIAERTPHMQRTLDASGGPIMSVIAFAAMAACGAWYGTVRTDGGDGHGFLNAFVVGRHVFGPLWPPPHFTVAAVTVFLFLNAAIVAIIAKRYVLSRLYSPHDRTPATSATPETLATPSTSLPA